MNPLKRAVSLLFLALCVGVFAWPLDAAVRRADREATEAPTGFDGRTNDLVDQATYDADKEVFADVEGIDDGVGPVFNALSCGECHANPIVGGSSQVLEMRAGHFDGTTYTDHPGGSLIHSRAIDPSIQEHVLDEYEVRTFRASTSLLGLGYVEAIADETITAIAESQPAATNGRVAGQVSVVPVHEVPGATRIGRFGWKNQHASLLSFSGDAYLNEMGITTPLFPVENSSNGRDCGEYDPLPDPDEGDNEDLDIFTRFIRSTKAPSRDAVLAATPEAQNGEQLFASVGCAVCHVSTITTAPVGTVLNGGTFTVPAALGDKVIHPFSDFLLHDIGSGDGIVNEGFMDSRNKLRTAPLWGLRTRNRLMHDGASLTISDAIVRHRGEAKVAARRFKRLSPAQRSDLLRFLSSL